MKKDQKKQGLIAGFSLILMAVAAGFSYGYAHSHLVSDIDENTLRNLLANKSLFFAELAGWSIIFLTDIIVAIALYYFFQSTSRQISKLTAIIRILYTLMLGFAILQLFRIVPILTSPDPITDQFVVSTTASHFKMFETIWSLGLIVFGFHLIGLGYLSLQSKMVPKLIGYLLYLGGFSYILVHGLRQLSATDSQLVSTMENILALPMALAEILFAFWLIYFGLRKSQHAT